MQSAQTAVEPHVPATSPRTARPKRWFVTAGKCAISSVLILWLLTGTSLHDIGTALQAAHFPTLLLAFSLHFLGCFISVVRWRLLLQAQHIIIPLPFLLKSYMVAIFFNNLLPSTIGGDVVRIHDTCRMGNNKGGAIAAVFLDRLLGIFILMGFVLYSLFFSGNLSFFLSYLHSRMIILILCFVTIIIAFLIFYKQVVSFSRKFNILYKIGNFIKNLLEHLLSIRKNKKIIVASLLLSLLLQINVVIYYFLISSGIGLSVSVNEFFVIVPVTVFTMMLPVSINGVGLRENIFVLVLSAYNVSKYNSIAMAWIDYGMIVLLGIIGGIVYMIRR
jgi:glycosyltransferase 2 family protein